MLPERPRRSLRRVDHLYRRVRRRGLRCAPLRGDGLGGEYIKVGTPPWPASQLHIRKSLRLAMTSVAGILFDAKKAVDSSDSASKPKISRSRRSGPVRRC